MAIEKEQYTLKEVLEIKTNHLKEIAALRDRMSELAINKAETAMSERMESSNNKFALLKEQAAMLPNRNDVESVRTECNIKITALTDKVDLLAKLVYIGMGILLVLEFLARFLFKT
jgi:hypothetical protein